MSDTPEQIAARLSPAQRALDVGIARACCGDERCWAMNDIDGWLPPGCATCWGKVDAVRAVLEAQKP